MQKTRGHICEDCGKPRSEWNPLKSDTGTLTLPVWCPECTRLREKLRYGNGFVLVKYLHTMSISQNVLALLDISKYMQERIGSPEQIADLWVELLEKARKEEDTELSLVCIEAFYNMLLASEVIWLIHKEKEPISARNKHSRPGYNTEMERLRKRLQSIYQTRWDPSKLQQFQKWTET